MRRVTNVPGYDISLQHDEVIYLSHPPKRENCNQNCIKIARVNVHENFKTKTIHHVT